MPNLVGIGLSQVPTNSMLGGMAYQDPDRVKIKKLNVDEISQINSEIADTAVDIFIYDTSKDSDGGAWRKRTTDTSWYNETLGTATRGTRREFPSVAVIVCTSTTVRIYDGDDPDLPMWMEFVTGGNWSHILVSTAGYIKAAEMLNGELVIARNLNTGWQLVKVSFITDTAYAYKNVAHGTGDGQWKGGIVARNGDGGYTTISTASNIDSQYNNDVAMTVLPNAPVDSATGLPVPTIAVATDAGVSVIKDNGTVVDIERTSDDDVHYVDLDGDRVIMFMELGAIYVATIPNSDQSGNPNSNWSVYGSYGGNTSGTDHPAVQAYGAGVDLVSMKDHTFATAGYNTSNDRYKGLSILSENVNSSGNGMVAWIRSDCNTGYMHGDIKGAFLSDTDTTNITSGEILSNGDFTNGTTGWTLQDAGEGSISVSSNQLTLNNSTSADPPVACYQQISLEVGKYYNVISDKASGLDVVVNITTGTSNGGGTGGYGNVIYHQNNIEQGATFLATAATMYCYIRVNTNATGTAVMNFVSIRKAEEDRSINNSFSRDKASALTINGTITKSAVATGADLVGYSPSSNTSYLEQPYNSALDYGTGDMYYSVWVYANSSDSFSSNTYIFERSSISDNNQRRIEARMTTPTRVEVYSCDTTLDNNVPVPSDAWFKLDIVRRSGEAFVYINGEYHSSTTGAAATRSLTDSNAKLVIGNRAYFATRQYAFPSNSKIALFRTGASAPSPEQIKKIYEDEKMLFQENAKCTLYGSSDAVTALGYDEVTRRLHVGTVSGRSDFQGLRRINNTTTAVTTAISAHDGFIVEQ